MKFGRNARIIPSNGNGCTELPVFPINTPPPGRVYTSKKMIPRMNLTLQRVSIPFIRRIVGQFSDTGPSLFDNPCVYVYIYTCVFMYIYIVILDGSRLLVLLLRTQQNNSESVLPIFDIRGIEFKGKLKEARMRGNRLAWERNHVVIRKRKNIYIDATEQLTAERAIGD